MRKSSIINSAGIQAVIFRKSPSKRGDPAWTYRDAMNYLNEYDIRPIKYHETDGFHRFRITPPKSYRNYYTVKVSPGVLAVIGMS